VGAANALRDTASLVSRNENDSPKASAKITSHPRKQAADFAANGKVLNLRADSKTGSAVTFLTNAQNKFTIRLRFCGAARSFPTSAHRYADK
jgi:hypothetical protein